MPSQYEHDIFKTNEPILRQIGAHGPRGKMIKQSSFVGQGGQWSAALITNWLLVKSIDVLMCIFMYFFIFFIFISHDAKVRFGGLAEASFSTHSVEYVY